MTIHYELILLYSLGFKPKEVCKYFGYSRGSAYRFYSIYRKARKVAQETLLRGHSVSPSERNKVNDLGVSRRKKSVSQREKWKRKVVDGTVIVTKVRDNG